MKKIIFLNSIPIFFLLIACNTNVSKHNKKGEYTLEIYDSIIFHQPGLIITDYRISRGLLLAYNRFDYSINIYDTAGIRKFNFNHRGEGPKEYNYIYFRALKFFSDTSVCLIDLNNLKIYSLNGDFIERIEYDSIKSPVKISNFNLINNKLIYIKNDQSYAGDINIYKDKLFRYYDFTKKSLFEVINFEEGSLYKNNDYFYTKVTPLFDVNAANGTFDIIFPYEPVIYRYDYNNGFSLKQKIRLHPAHFSTHIEGIPFGKRINNSFFYEQINPAYEYITIRNGMTFLIYREAIDKDNIYQSAAEYNNNIDKIKRYLEITGKDNIEKRDILLPSSRVAFIATVVSENFILFYKTPNEFDENNNTSTFIKAKLVKYNYQ